MDGGRVDGLGSCGGEGGIEIERRAAEARAVESCEGRYEHLEGPHDFVEYYVC